MAVYRATAVITHPALGGNGTNTWHVRTVGEGIGLPEQTELGIHTDALQAFYTNAGNILAGGTSIEFDGRYVRVDDDSDAVIDVDGWNFTVTGTTAPMPPADCMVVGWRTNTASKRARGRTFMGPLRTTTLQDNGTPTEAARLILTDACGAFLDTFSDIGDGAFGVWSAADSVLRDFTGYAVANRYAVLRSRRD